MKESQVDVVATQSYDNLLRQYQFWDISDKKNDNQLPPYRLYDCPIELLLLTEILFGHLFLFNSFLLKIKNWINHKICIIY